MTWKNICKDKDARPKEQKYTSWKELPPIPISFPANFAQTGSWRTLRPVIRQDKCTKCGFCFLYCPEGTVQENSNGYFNIDYVHCKGCGVCAHECPSKAIDMVVEKDAEEEENK